MKVPFDETERLNADLDDEAALRKFKMPGDTYAPGPSARFFGGLLIGTGNLLYGAQPSYLKFRAIEVIARVPYHSWASAAFTLLTLVFTDEARAMKLSKFSWFAEFAQDNETMHVVVISELTRAEGRVPFIRGTLIPTVFAFFYFWVSYWMYLIHPRSSLELNFIFESHAFEQYQEFLDMHADALKRKPAVSRYLLDYGRDPRSQYEFFRSVRNDELIHRDATLRQISEL